MTFSVEFEREPVYYDVTLKDVPVEELGQLPFPAYIDVLHITFTSRAGICYTIGNILQHPEGPYINVSSEVGERKYPEDFEEVRQEIARAYGGRLDGDIKDRYCDLFTIIRVNNLTIEDIVKAIAQLDANRFSDVSISRVFYHRVPEKLQEEWEQVLSSEGKEFKRTQKEYLGVLHGW